MKDTKLELDDLVHEAKKTRPPPAALASVARRLGIAFSAGSVVALSPQVASAHVKPLLADSLLRGFTIAAGLGASGALMAIVINSADPNVIPARPAILRPASPPALLAPAPSPESAPPEAPAAGAEPSAPPERAQTAAVVWDEPRLIERARLALTSDPRRALSIGREHQRRFPSGALAVEREVIMIEALARVGQAPEALARAERFEAKHPTSIHLPRIRSLRARLAPGR